MRSRHGSRRDTAVSAPARSPAPCTDFIIDAIARGGYWGIFLLMAIENVFPPIPSEVIMGIGGIAGRARDDGVLAAAVAGTVGHHRGQLRLVLDRRQLVGYQRLAPFVDRHGRWLTLEWEDIEKLHRFFRKHGGKACSSSAFMPTFRTMISLPAGMACMPRWRFFLATFTGSIVWNAVLAYAGLWLGSNFEQLDHYVGPVAIGMSVAIVLF